MDEYTKQLIEDVRATYQDVVTGNDSRIQRGTVLWDQFEDAAEACRIDAKGAERALADRINELAVAKILAEDVPRRDLSSCSNVRGYAISLSATASSPTATRRLVSKGFAERDVTEHWSGRIGVTRL